MLCNVIMTRPSLYSKYSNSEVRQAFCISAGQHAVASSEVDRRVLQRTVPNYLMPPKMSKYAEKICNMRTLLKYAKNAAKCQICGNRIFAFFLHAYNILPHFCWNADFIQQSSLHVFLKMSTAKKCSCLWKTSFHCFRQSCLLVWANN